MLLFPRTDADSARGCCSSRATKRTEHEQEAFASALLGAQRANNLVSRLGRSALGKARLLRVLCSFNALLEEVIFYFGRFSSSRGGSSVVYAWRGSRRTHAKGLHFILFFFFTTTTAGRMF